MNIIKQEGATPSPSPLAAAIDRALAKPSTTFIDRGSDANLVTITGRIKAGMTDNPAYPDSVPTLDVVGLAFDGFVAAVNGNDRGKVAIAARDKARRQLGVVLRSLALYVAQHCKGDLVTLLSSGFPAQRKRSATVQVAPGTPAGIRLRAGGLSGQINGLCERVEGAMLYQWRYATVQAPTAFTVTDTDSKTSVSFENLLPGTQYLVQVRACGRRGSSDWSDQVLVYAR